MKITFRLPKKDQKRYKGGAGSGHHGHGGRPGKRGGSSPGSGGGSSEPSNREIAAERGKITASMRSIPGLTDVGVEGFAPIRFVGNSADVKAVQTKLSALGYSKESRNNTMSGYFDVWSDKTSKYVTEVGVNNKQGVMSVYHFVRSGNR